MTGGRGRGSREASSSNSISSGVKTRVAIASSVGAVSGTKSGMCMASLGDISISCDSCNSRYHLTPVSFGLPDSIINTIEEYGGKGINFIYTSCRLERGSDSIGPQSGSIIDGSRGLDGGVSQ